MMVGIWDKRVVGSVIDTRTATDKYTGNSSLNPGPQQRRVPEELLPRVMFIYVV